MEKKGELGILKSETADILIVEAIYLVQKCYSISQDNDKVMNTAKGAPQAMKQMKLTPDVHRETRDGIIKSVSAHVSLEVVKSSMCVDIIASLKKQQSIHSYAN